jgi:transglutaminase-like putative cysteine protease
MLYDIRHSTTYLYEADVTLSHQLVRLTPRELPYQRCLAHELIVQPTPSALYRQTDYFGNSVTALTIELGHGTFCVESRSRVELRVRKAPDPADTPAWDEINVAPGHEALFQDPTVDEFLYESPLVRRLPELATYAAPSFPPARPVLEAAIDLTARLHADFKFDSKATTVATPLSEVLRLRRGVCQDFAQLQIGCLRAFGLPARYVSGYLETVPPPGRPKLIGTDASHAWVSFYCPDHGWIDLDPTNNVLPSDRHVTVAWGRDYSDVPPIRGVILGAGNHALKVSVDVTPVVAAERTPPAPAATDPT